MPFDEIYKWVGVLRMDVGKMDLWEFMQATKGYAESKGEKPRGGTISDDRMSELGIAGFG